MKNFAISNTHRRSLIAIAALLQFGAGTALAGEIDTDVDGLSLRWDNTFKYSAAGRLKGQSDALVNDAPASNSNSLNLDDGDRNFGKGLISSRIDLLSELDLDYQKTFGARVSAAGWYDYVYNRSNDHANDGRFNQTSVAYNEFTDATRKIHGRKAEFLDAFIYASNGDGNVRIGRHSVLYGETLFFGANGIANAQAPVDYVKLLSVPGSQFKEIILPVNQISGQFKIAEGLTAGAYYQFEWRKSRIPGVGSYFSTADVFDAGGENFLLAPQGAPVPLIPRVPDREAKNSGQGGVQLRWRPSAVDVEFGFYAARYHEKLFQTYLRANPIFSAGAFPGPVNYQLVYPEGVRTYGVSASTIIGDYNVAGEVSVRRNAPLVGGATIDLNPLGSGIGGSAAYPVGSTAHVNLSAVGFFSGKGQPWDNASVLAEVGWNRVTSVTMNAAALDPTTTRDAWGFRFLAEPTWFQVAPGVDVSAPLAVGYNPKGRSGAVQLFNGGVDKGGDMSIGLRATYQQVWKFGVNFTHFYGAAGGALGADTYLTFKQSLKDRDFVSLSVQRTF